LQDTILINKSISMGAVRKKFFVFIGLRFLIIS